MGDVRAQWRFHADHRVPRLGAAIDQSPVVRSGPRPEALLLALTITGGHPITDGFLGNSNNHYDRGDSHSPVLAPHSVREPLREPWVVECAEAKLLRPLGERAGCEAGARIVPEAVPGGRSRS